MPFPDLTPNRIASLQTADYSSISHEWDDGGELRIPIQHISIGSKIQAEYNNVSGEDAHQLIQFYRDTTGETHCRLSIEYNQLTNITAKKLLDFYNNLKGKSYYFRLPGNILKMVPAQLQVLPIFSNPDQLWVFDDSVDLRVEAATKQFGIYKATAVLKSITSFKSQNIVESQWKFAGYRDGGSLPIQTDYAWTVSASDTGLFGANAVFADGTDQSIKLQNIIDSLDNTFLNRTYNRMLKLVLPSGNIRIENQIILHTSFVTVAGHGINNTKIIFQPGLNCRYDVDLSGSGSSDGDDFDLSAMSHGESNGGWIFPGRACFRIQSKRVHPRYDTEFTSAPSNRKDFYFGSVNFPWRSGINVRQTSPFAAYKGDVVIPLATAPLGVYIGSYILLYAANTKTWYNSIGVTNTAHHRSVPIVRTRVYRVVAIDTVGNSVTIDKPLEFDIPANQQSQGDAMLSASQDSSYFSNIVPLDTVLGSGIEDLQITQPMQNMPAVDGSFYNLSTVNADHNYTNLAAEYAIHGFVIKWAANCFVRRCSTSYTGSHAIATEFVKNIQVENCFFHGSWNKGKGGNGYVRFSKCFDSIIQSNVLGKLRHITFQWSSSFNVMLHNTMDCDINLHGGWERYNLIESNNVNVPFEHRFGDVNSTNPSNGATWFPIWWGAGAHAGKWSASTGDKNVFYRNVMTKQITSGGSFTPYQPYSNQNTAYIFGWDRASQTGSYWVHLAKNGTNITAWNGNEQVDFTVDPNTGVAKSEMKISSLFDLSKAQGGVLAALPEIPGLGSISYNTSGYNMHLSSKYSAKNLNASNRITSISNIVNNSLIAAPSTREPFIGALLNGYQTVDFNGNELLTIPSTVAGSKTLITWFFVLRVNSSANTQERILEVKFGSAGYQLYLTGTSFNRIILGFFNDSGSFIKGITLPENETNKGGWVCVSFSVNYSTGEVSLWSDYFDKRTDTGINTPANAFSSGLIGGRSNDATMFTGEIAEALQYNSIVPDYNRYNIMKKLLSEYRLNR